MMIHLAHLPFVLYLYQLCTNLFIEQVLYMLLSFAFLLVSKEITFGLTCTLFGLPMMGLEEVDQMGLVTARRAECIL